MVSIIVLSPGVNYIQSFRTYEVENHLLMMPYLFSPQNNFLISLIIYCQALPAVPSRYILSLSVFSPSLFLNFLIYLFSNFIFFLFVKSKVCEKETVPYCEIEFGMQRQTISIQGCNCFVWLREKKKQGEKTM